MECLEHLVNIQDLEYLSEKLTWEQTVKDKLYFYQIQDKRSEFDRINTTVSQLINPLEKSAEVESLLMASICL